MINSTPALIKATSHPLSHNGTLSKFIIIEVHVPQSMVCCCRLRKWDRAHAQHTSARGAGVRRGWATARDCCTQARNGLAGMAMAPAACRARTAIYTQNGHQPLPLAGAAASALCPARAPLHCMRGPCHAHPACVGARESPSPLRTRIRIRTGRMWRRGIPINGHGQLMDHIMI